MASPNDTSGTDIESLTSVQRQSLDQLRELTNGADDEVSMGVLRTVEWDVQKAAEMIFEGGNGSGSGNVNRNDSSSSPASHSSTTATTTTQRDPSRTPIQHFEVTDDHEDEPPIGYGRTGGRRNRNIGVIPRPVMAILSLPLALLTSLFRFVFHILRFPFYLISGTPRRGYGYGSGLGLGFLGLGLGTGSRRRGLVGVQGVTGVEKWVRELEEETGAVCLGPKSGANSSASSTGASTSANGVSTLLNASNGTLNARNPASGSKPVVDFEDGTKKYLPDFQLCTYEDLLKKCQKEMKIACVVLVSEEHDDVGEFKRSTLTDPKLLKTLYDNDILVWGGDVRDREAWSASEKLQATTYPFVGYIALQPRRDPGGSGTSSRSSPPVLTVLSRHQGPSESVSAPTSASTLTAHLTTSLLPRVQTYLSRLILQETQRQRDRQLRVEQDRQYEESMMRDRRRIEEAMRKEKEEKERIEREKRVAEDMKKNMKKREMERAAVGIWIAKWIKPRGGADGAKIAIRLPSGSRVIQVFDKDNSTITELYARVDRLLVDIADDAHGASPLDVPLDSNNAEVVLDKYISNSLVSSRLYAYPSPSAFWGFTVATSYPRVEIPWSPQTKLSSIGGGALVGRGGGQVVVEMEGRRSLDSVNPTSAEDGYETESSDED